MRIVIDVHRLANGVFVIGFPESRSDFYQSPEKMHGLLSLEAAGRFVAREASKQVKLAFNQPSKKP